jgi:hypothetical protein
MSGVRCAKLGNSTPPNTLDVLKGCDGDRINAVLAAVGCNFSLLLRWFEELLRALIVDPRSPPLGARLRLTRESETFFKGDDGANCDAGELPYLGRRTTGLTRLGTKMKVGPLRCSSTFSVISPKLTRGTALCFLKDFIYRDRAALARFPHSPLIFAALMIGHHFSISAFCKEPSASGVCSLLSGISMPTSGNFRRRAGSANALTTAS